ncbi:MAG: bifunctional ADP-dependent (S)-NAD(P)H-hydrate dehydratase/NAD(P)H-hydrate epimerase [Rhodoferax ferrireducens]|uniref:Bifunctional NAD(P)H-hydrate repair enzyme n=1 Tax=Rhodoferax ferrireducens TaxID=192843 RepID=A0A1W9KR69_9BURK|nr:MAG: bifunctional ADP-dependent (S)-NAD(P)H-hydrate dehydratase/NAD(P)H-hydrate epimerase [Rhodoferax ferrireducens]
MRKITPGTRHPLFGVDQTRRIEVSAAENLPPHTLMQRAGLAVARLALAVAPHAQRIWIACGPGNNGGDGLEAAIHLQRWGKQPVVTWLGDVQKVPPDTAAAYQQLMDAGIAIEAHPSGNFDLCIDALLGIGGQLREPYGQMADWVRHINASGAPVLSVDTPTGLHADTGQTTKLHVQASHTLSLLTLKPGLFTANGRDAIGTLWLDTLGLAPGTWAECELTAWLNEKPSQATRPHASHKGSYGDVAVIGGAPGMTGAALLAASAALHAGAGRVFVGLLDDHAMTVDVQQPELMFRPVSSLELSRLTVVCGCGGGQAVAQVLLAVLGSSAPVVLDADAINIIAENSSLQTALVARSTRKSVTVLTPHPLEAARLLGKTVHQVQHDRLSAVTDLAHRFACTVVLKGSGTLIASPGQIPVINPTGNARLATAGTGDVLAGMLGAQLAAGHTGFEAARRAVYRHGELADAWPEQRPLTAGTLAIAWGT